MTRYICDQCEEWVEFVDPAARVTHDCRPAGRRRPLRPTKEEAKR